MEKMRKSSHGENQCGNISNINAVMKYNAQIPSGMRTKAIILLICFFLVPQQLGAIFLQIVQIINQNLFLQVDKANNESYRNVFCFWAGGMKALGNINC